MILQANKSIFKTFSVRRNYAFLGTLLCTISASLTVQPEVHAQIPGVFTNTLQCNNDPFSNSARGTFKGSVNVPGTVITDYNMRAIFSPELVNKPMTTRFFPAGRSITLDADARSTQKDVLASGTYRWQGEINTPFGSVAWRGVSTTPGSIAPCLPQPGSTSGSSGGSGGSGGGNCPPGTYQVGNTSQCVASGPRAAYTDPNRLVATTFDRPAVQTQAAPADPAQDLTKWEGVSWQADRADN
jgi:hypothetical protein